MTHATNILTRTLALAATVCAVSLTSGHAFANEMSASASTVEAKVWVHEKTAVSHAPTVIRMDEPLPTLVAPLNISMKIDRFQDAQVIRNSQAYDTDADFRTFDLIEDNPVFIGAPGTTEFDTRDAQRDSGAYPETLGVDPLYTVAGAGLSTSF